MTWFCGLPWNDKTVAAAIRALSPDLEAFVVEVVEQEIARRAQLAVLRDIAGMWRDGEDIPLDTPDVVVDLVRRMRADEEHPPL